MNTFYDYLHYMQTGGAPVQQQSQANDEQKQIMQIIQMYAQITRKDPKKLMQELQQMQPEEQQKTLQMIVQTVQQASQQQSQQGMSFAQEGGARQLKRKARMQQQDNSFLESPEVQQIIQIFAQIQGVDPQEIMAQLAQLSPEEQQQAIQEMAQVVQQVMSQQQQQGAAMQQQGPSMEEQAAMQQQPMMIAGGSSNPGPGTYNPGMNTYFGGGGAFVPTYAEYAYGGPHSEIPSLFNQPVDRPNKAMYGMGMMAKGGQHQVGDVLDVTPEELESLKRQGYKIQIER
jgi:hypothetical protein